MRPACSSKPLLVLDVDGVMLDAERSFMEAVAIRLQGVSLPGIGQVPVQVVQALPYLMTVVLLAGFIGSARAPRALGIAYVKER